VHGDRFGKDVRDCAAFRGSLSIERRRAFEDHFMRWTVTLCLISIAALPLGLPASAADDPLQNPLHQACLVYDAGWIGKSEKEVDANCACKAKTEASLASPEFREAILKKGVYEGGAFPFGDYGAYQERVLTECPKLRPLMIEALCNDPAAPPDACKAVKDMVSKLK
jgi:hypothetical protein